MDSSEDENDEVLELQHWNNWTGPKKQLSERGTTKEKITKKYVFKKAQFLTISSVVRDSKYRNWIPPVNFINFRDGKSSLRKAKNKIATDELPVTAIKYNNDKISQKWSINTDWGKRVELNDAGKYNDGEKIWSIVNLGLFGRIKLWVNEYKNICVLAEGTVSKICSTEAVRITIVNAEILRKMLYLSSAQWTSLCEAVTESNVCLNFDAFLDYDLANKSLIHKMWYFICKRRHFLQDQCMLIKLNGAVKCMKRFEIIPKLVVQDVRNLKGEPIP